MSVRGGAHCDYSPMGQKKNPSHCVHSERAKCVTDRKMFETEVLEGAEAHISCHLWTPSSRTAEISPPISSVCLHFVIVVPNICGPSVWNVFHIIQLAPGTLGWFLEFWNICGPLSQYILVTLSHFSNFILKYKLRLKFSFSIPAFNMYRFPWYGKFQLS
jgi:hypothetical protein